MLGGSNPDHIRSTIDGRMAKRKPQKQSASETLAEVIKEMAKPRVVMSGTRTGK
jgi:hypothetical protein